MQNKGNDVFDFDIAYGTRPLPFRSGPDPVFSAGGSRVHMDEMIVPRSATVRWKTKDGVDYCPTVEIRRHLKDPNSFEGTVQFNISQEMLEVMLIPRKKEIAEGAARERIFVGTAPCELGRGATVIPTKPN